MTWRDSENDLPPAPIDDSLAQCGWHSGGARLCASHARSRPLSPLPSSAFARPLPCHGALWNRSPASCGLHLKIFSPAVATSLPPSMVASLLGLVPKRVVLTLLEFFSFRADDIDCLALPILSWLHRK